MGMLLQRRGVVASATFSLVALVGSVVGGDRTGAVTRTREPRVPLPNLYVSQLTNPPASVKQGGSSS